MCNEVIKSYTFKILIATFPVFTAYSDGPVVKIHQMLLKFYHLSYITGRYILVGRTNFVDLRDSHFETNVTSLKVVLISRFLRMRKPKVFQLENI